MRVRNESSGFFEKVLVKIQGECKNSSSNWKLELSAVWVIGIQIYGHNMKLKHLEYFLLSDAGQWFYHLGKVTWPLKRHSGL